MTAEAAGVRTEVEIGTATATDLFQVTITKDAPEDYPVGTTVVTWTATDANGNVATAEQRITVKDSIKPVLTVPADITVNSTGVRTIVNIGTASASDIFAVTITNDAPYDYPVGTTIVTWTATDANGNITTAVQRVTVIEKIRVEMCNTNKSTESNSIYPKIRIYNNGAAPINLSDLKIRYYYTIDSERQQSFWCDYATAGAGNITGTFVKMDFAAEAADYYLELGFKADAGSLAPGSFTEIVARFAKSDWSNYDQSWDYSFNGTATDCVEWDRVTVYSNGNCIWGREPEQVSNLALNKTAAASSLEDASYNAGYAVDGNTSTRWSSQFSDPQWIYVDLGAVKTVKGVKLNWEAAYGRSYSIQVSNDAANWNSVFSTTSGDGGIDYVQLSPVSAKYIRIYGTQRGLPYGYSLYEIEVYGS